MNRGGSKITSFWELYSQINACLKQQKPFSFKLNNGVEILVKPVPNGLLFQSDLEITVTLNLITPKALQMIAEAFTAANLEEKLWKTTIELNLLWSAGSIHHPKVLINCLVRKVPPSLLALLNQNKGKSIQRCIDCPYRYSPACKGCELNGTCSRCGIKMKWDPQKRDYVCPLCKRTFTQEMLEAATQK